MKSQKCKKQALLERRILRVQSHSRQKALMFGFVTLRKKYGSAMDAPIFNGDPLKLSLAVRPKDNLLQCITRILYFGPAPYSWFRWLTADFFTCPRPSALGISLRL